MKSRIIKGILAASLAFVSVLGAYDTITKTDSPYAITASAAEVLRQHYYCSRLKVDGTLFIANPVEVKVYDRNGVPVVKVYINHRYITEFRNPRSTYIDGYYC